MGGATLTRGGPQALITGHRAGDRRFFRLPGSGEPGRTSYRLPKSGGQAVVTLTGPTIRDRFSWGERYGTVRNRMAESVITRPSLLARIKNTGDRQAWA